MTGLEIMMLAGVALFLGTAIIATFHSRELNRAMDERTRAQAEAWRITIALQHIAAATANINHGTARKVHRMAKEGLNGNEG